MDEKKTNKKEKKEKVEENEEWYQTQMMCTLDDTTKRKALSLVTRNR